VSNAALILWLLVKLAGLLLAMQYVSAALVAVFIVPPVFGGRAILQHFYQKGAFCPK